MTIQYGASRAFNYPEDNFDELDTAPVAATAATWREVIQMAKAGNPLAQKVHRLGRAKNAKKFAEAKGTAVPEWAREVLAPIEDESEGLEEALSALARAVK